MRCTLNCESLFIECCLRFYRILAEEFEKSSELERMQRELEARLTEEQSEKEAWLREQQNAMKQHQDQINNLRAEKLLNEQKLTVRLV